MGQLALVSKLYDLNWVRSLTFPHKIVDIAIDQSFNVQTKYCMTSNLKSVSKSQS